MLCPEQRSEITLISRSVRLKCKQGAIQSLEKRPAMRLYR